MQNKKLRKENVTHTRSLPASSINISWIPIIIALAVSTLLVIYVFVIAWRILAFGI